MKRVLYVLILIMSTVFGKSANAQMWVDVYDVTIQGPAIPNVVGAQAFKRTGLLYVTPTVTSLGITNGINPLDAYLVSGSPAGSPDSGAISFATNSFFFGGSAGRSQIDLAYVTGSSSGKKITLNIRPDASFGTTFMNVFTARPGLTATLYFIGSGSVDLTFDFSKSVATLSGSINLVSQKYNVPYKATVTGKYRTTLFR